MTTAIQLDPDIALEYPDACVNTGLETLRRLQLSATGARRARRKHGLELRSHVPMGRASQALRAFYLSGWSLRLLGFWVGFALGLLVLALVDLLLPRGSVFTQMTDIGLLLGAVLIGVVATGFFGRFGDELFQRFLPNVYDAYHAAELVVDYDGPKSEQRLDGWWLLVRDENWAKKVRGGGERLRLPEIERAGQRRDIDDAHSARLVNIGRMSGILSGMLVTGLAFALAGSVFSSLQLLCFGVMSLPGFVLGGLLAGLLSWRYGLVGAIQGGISGGLLLPLIFLGPVLLYPG